MSSWHSLSKVPLFSYFFSFSELCFGPFNLSFHGAELGHPSLTSPSDQSLYSNSLLLICRTRIWASLGHFISHWPSVFQPFLYFLCTHPGPLSVWTLFQRECLSNRNFGGRKFGLLALGGTNLPFWLSPFSLYLLVFELCHSSLYLGP